MLGLLLGLGPRLKFDVFQQNTIMYPVGVRLKTCYIMNTPDLLENQQEASYGFEVLCGVLQIVGEVWQGTDYGNSLVLQI